MWYTIPDTIPADAATVWCRTDQYTSVPFQAVFDLAGQTFTSVTNSIVFPAYAISRWRDL